jgi:hypothetical protein
MLQSNENFRFLAAVSWSATQKTAAVLAFSALLLTMPFFSIYCFSIALPGRRVVEYIQKPIVYGRFHVAFIIALALRTTMVAPSILGRAGRTQSFSQVVFSLH